MRKIQILLILLFVSCSNLKYLEPFDRFKNKPKSIESTTYSITYIDSLAKEEVAYKFILLYDSKGRKIKNSGFKSDGSPSAGGEEYTYDKYGNNTQIILYKQDRSINTQINFRYNKFGQKTEREYISGWKKSITKYIFDRKNRVEKIIEKRNDSSISENAIQKYDKNWRKIELISNDSSNKQKSRIEFFYDKKNNEIQSKWYNSENKLYEYYKSTYNFYNDRIRIEKYHIRSGESKLVSDTKTEYKYDEKGNCIEERLISNGKTSWITKNEYKYVW
jgi:YD repeat-containing protein